MAKASVILRFSNRSKARARNLRAVIEHMLELSPRTIEIIVICMDKDIDLPEYHGDGRVAKYFFDTPFESAQANNIGAALANTNIFIFQDADIVFDLQCYRDIIKAIRTDEYESVRVGEECSNLSEKVFGRHRKPENLRALIAREKRSCVRDAPGACIALSREAFMRIGGHCELFKVYGWEDCYFRYKVKKLTKQKSLKKLMFHFPHEGNFQMKYQPDNAKLYQEIVNTDDGDCKKLAERDRKYLLKQYNWK